MQVNEVMSRSVELIDPNTTIRDAAIKMRDEDVGALPVGEKDRLIGMVTDRDIVCRGVAQDRAPASTTVRDVMSSNVVYCFEDEPVEAAAGLMADKQVRRLPVLNSDKRLVGIVSLADLARTEAEGPEAAKAALKEISEPSARPRG